MLTSDRQILKLPEILKNNGKIEYIKEFYEETGIPKSWFSNVKNQDKRNRSYHFTAEQIEIIIKLYNIDANFIFGITTTPFK